MEGPPKNMPGAPHTTPGRRRLAEYTIRLHGTRQRDGKKALGASQPWPVHRDPSSDCILSDAFPMNRVRRRVLSSNLFTHGYWNADDRSHPATGTDNNPAARPLYALDGLW